MPLAPDLAATRWPACDKTRPPTMIEAFLAEPCVR
jgi:hypothetical protein